MSFGFAWSPQRQYPVSSSPTISPTLELNSLLSEKEKNESGFNFYYFVYILLAISKIRWIKSGDETLKSNRYEVQNCW